MSENQLWLGREWLCSSIGLANAEPARPLTPARAPGPGDLGVVRHSKEVETKAPSCPGLTSHRDGESTVGIVPLALSLWGCGRSPNPLPQDSPEDLLRGGPGRGGSACLPWGARPSTGWATEI